MPGVTHDDAPLLAELLPWSVAAPRIGRAWPLAPEAASLRARWDAFVRAGRAEREALMEPTRARELRSAVAQLPGRDTSTAPLAEEDGPCPEPVRVLHAPFDEQWLIPDHRLIDAARPELWRVADARQIFLVEQPTAPGESGPAVLATSLLPGATVPQTGAPTVRPGRIRPLYRRPGGLEPNLAPGLVAHLAAPTGARVSAEELPAWILAAARSGPKGPVVPLPRDAGVWARGVELGSRLLWLMRRGPGERPKLPGGRRPYVRAPLPARPEAPQYDPAEETLLIGSGRVAPVPAAAWEFRIGTVPVLESWFARRAAVGAPGSLAAIGPSAWPQARTTELLELITVLALLAELRPRQEELGEELGDPGESIGRDELCEAGVLPPPDSARRPASVLDHQEEGPGGQFALL
ncbi:DNA methyltransferase [Streptomyces sp. NA04227]|uniref:type ISP restriction/modification enzyme n=1 Tax=Streptomyces sp. NA04227 TaxID=2742136 RepID=UPI001591D417|nr:type ISP restriction/modification enzyme [Streptomyces sp. NA04227]QKW05689.1 DNA methyltransferase [Streptomyces sp. NA04227]